MNASRLKLRSHGSVLAVVVFSFFVILMSAHGQSDALIKARPDYRNQLYDPARLPRPLERHWPNPFRSPRSAAMSVQRATHGRRMTVR